MKKKLIRILVYEGTPAFIHNNLLGRVVKGSIQRSNGRIDEIIVGEFLETLEPAEPATFSNPTGKEIQ